MSDRNQAQVIQSLTDLNQILVKHDEVGEATSLALSITQMLKAPLLDLKCIRLRQRLDILKMYLKEQPLAVIQAYTKAQADIQRLLNSSLEPSSRTLRMTKVRDALKNVSVFNMCVRDLNLNGILVSSSKIGEGGYGKVYKGIITGVPTVLKTVRLNESGDKLNLKELAAEAGVDLTSLPEEYQPQEYKLGVTLNGLVLAGQCPNFMLTYDVGTCGQGEAVYFLEEASFDLDEAFKQSFFGPVSQVSLLAQLLIALYYVHTRLKVVHRDIKAENILLLETPSLARTLMSYEVDGRTFILENTGVIPCLADFGMSKTRRRINASNDIADCIATFLGGKLHTVYSYDHEGYPDLSTPLKQALEKAYSTTFNNALDALTFILEDVKYSSPTNLPVSKVLKSITQLSPSELDKIGVHSNTALVKAAMEGRTEAVKDLANRATQPYFKLALVAAAVNGDTGTIDVLIDRGANNYEDLVLTLMMMVTGKAGRYLSYLSRPLSLSFLVSLVLASSSMDGGDVAPEDLVKGLQDREDLSELLVAAGFNGSVEVAKAIIDEGATNLDQALRAAKLTGSREVVELLESRGAQEGGADPTLQTSILGPLKTLGDLSREYRLNNDRVRELLKVWDNIKECEIDADTALVRATVEGRTEAAKELADRATEPYLNLALVAAAVKGDTSTIDVLINKGADNYEALILTLTIAAPTKAGRYLSEHPPKHLNTSFFITFILASFNMERAGAALKALIRRHLRSRKYLPKLLVAAGLNGSVAVTEVILDEGATNLDQALRAAKLTGNQRVVKLLESKGAQEGGADPTLPEDSLYLYEAINDLVEKYQLDSDRATGLAKFYNQVKEFREP